MSGDLPLYEKDELRAITNSDRNRDNSVMMSSVMPSVKYSCSGSSLMLWKGSTAIDGLSGKPSPVSAAGSDAGAAVGDQCQTSSGRLMFLRVRVPPSSNGTSS